MSASMLRRLAPAVLLFALAFPSHADAMSWPFEELFGRVRGFISSLWEPHGCVIDPDGRCGTAPAPIFGEIGCVLMPDGNCKNAPAPIFGEHGCEIHPDGRCGAAPAPIFGEIGCELEPDGRCRG